MIVFKEEFVGGEKWRRAAKLGRSDAIVMWLALKCYASKYPNTEGFVPDEELDELPGAPRAARKALQALIDCGRLLPDGTRGPGLVEPAEGGWQLHDYLDHSVSPEEIELRRERARLKKQKQRDQQRRELEALQSGVDMSRGVPGDKRGHVPGDTGGDVPSAVPGTVPEVSLAGARPPASVPARAPNPTQPTPTQPKLKQNPKSETEVARPRESSPEPRFRPPEDTGTRGHLRIEPQLEHRKFAEKHGLDVEAIVERLRRDPRSKTLSTVSAWELITKMLDKELDRQQRLGGAA